MSTETSEASQQSDRRDLIKKAVAAGAIVWTVPTISSGVASAAGGTPKCQPTLDTFLATATASLRESTNKDRVLVQSDITATGGSCPCSTDSPTYEYFFHVELDYTKKGVTTTYTNDQGWDNLSSFTWNPANKFKAGEYRFEWGARVICPAQGGPAWTCRFGSAQGPYDEKDGVTSVGPLALSSATAANIDCDSPEPTLP